jgi:hypothetical protein
MPGKRCGFLAARMFEANQAMRISVSTLSKVGRAATYNLMAVFLKQGS